MRISHSLFELALNPPGGMMECAGISVSSGKRGEITHTMLISKISLVLYLSAFITVFIAGCCKDSCTAFSVFYRHCDVVHC